MLLDPDASRADRPRFAIAVAMAILASALACGPPDPGPVPEIAVLPSGSQIVVSILWTPEARETPPVVLHAFDPVTGEESAWTVDVSAHDNAPYDFRADATGVTLGYRASRDACFMDHVDPSGVISGWTSQPPERRVDWVTPEPIFTSDGAAWAVTEEEQVECTTLVRLYAPHTRTPIHVPEAFDHPMAFTWAADGRSVLFGALCDLQRGCRDPMAPPPPRLPDDTVVDECLYSAPIDGGFATELWRYDSWGPMGGVIERMVPSPTGDRVILFVGSASGGKPWIVDLTTGRVVELTVPMPTTGMYAANHGGVGDVAWSPDGQQIALLSDHEAPCDSVYRMSVVCENAVYVANSDGTGLRRLGERWLYASQIAWR